MRTTLTLDEDVFQWAHRLSKELDRPFKQVINAALREGLPLLELPAASKPYRTEPRAMGLRAGLSLDNVAELLAQVEGEDSR
jgi:hypothetical protein